MNKNKLNLAKKIIPFLVVVLILTLLSSCGKKDYTVPLGEGENVFDIVFEKGEKEFSRYKIFTNEVTVGAALLEQDLITYSETENGEYYVSVADGKSVDFDKTGEYWAIYDEDGYVSSDPDEAAIMCGNTYIMRIEKLPAFANPDDMENDA